MVHLSHRNIKSLQYVDAEVQQSFRKVAARGKARRTLWEAAPRGGAFGLFRSWVNKVPLDSKTGLMICKLCPVFALFRALTFPSHRAAQFVGRAELSITVSRIPT